VAVAGLSNLCNVVAGVVYFRVDGVQYWLRGECQIELAMLEREMVTGQDGIHGYIERPVPSKVTCKLTDRPDLSITFLLSLCNVTVTVELLNRKVYLLRNAVCIKAGPFDTTDGSLEVEFDGTGEEILAAA
jgi:hypothetical protein